MARIRLTKWGKDHLLDPNKKGKFTICGIMLPFAPLEPKYKRICVICRKGHQTRTGRHPMEDEN